MRRLVILLAILVTTAVAASACSRSADTTAVESTPGRRQVAAPTSTIVHATSTTAPPTTTAVAAVGSTDPTAALSAVVAALAADPSIASRLAQLTSFDPSQIASMLEVDPAVLQQLQLGPSQLAQLARGLGSPSAGTSVPTDPAALLALLMGSLDAESLLNGTIATLVQALLGAITGTTIVVSPDITVDMGEILGELDPDGIGPIVANPSNASLLALLTSAWLSENPLFAEQFLADPSLDPELHSLLLRLQRLTDTIGETARDSLLEALHKLFPGLPTVG